ncbi:MAG: hypothetical protein AAFO81_07805, partial [Pseudomonadota bacterium]
MSTENRTEDIEFRWKNYKCFEDTGWLKIKPLTILLGPNSSGKSSLISPLLMMGQTMLSRDIQSPLVTKGEFIDAGGYKNFVHDQDTKK